MLNALLTHFMIIGALLLMLVFRTIGKICDAHSVSEEHKPQGGAS